MFRRLSLSQWFSLSHIYTQFTSGKKKKSREVSVRGRKRKKKKFTGSVLFQIGSCRHITEQDGGSVRSGENVHKTKVAQVRKMGFKTLRTVTPLYTSFRGESQRRASGPCASDNQMERPPSNGTRCFFFFSHKNRYTRRRTSPIRRTTLGFISLVKN